MIFIGLNSSREDAKRAKRPIKLELILLLVPTSTFAHSLKNQCPCHLVHNGRELSEFQILKFGKPGHYKSTVQAGNRMGKKRQGNAAVPVIIHVAHPFLDGRRKLMIDIDKSGIALLNPGRKV